MPHGQKYAHPKEETWPYANTKKEKQLIRREKLTTRKERLLTKKERPLTKKEKQLEKRQHAAAVTANLQHQLACA